MSLLNGSPDENSGSNQHINGLNSNFHVNGKNSQREATHNGNGGLNNNQDEYKMDMKTNGNDKVAEDDPLTGHRRWDLIQGGAKEPRWSQKFASTNFFMLIFLLAYVLQGSYRVSMYTRV